MKKIYVLDRIEDGIATIVCDDGEAVNVSPDTLVNISVGDVFSADICDGKILDIEAMPDETIRRRQQARSMLSRLKNKKQN